ncbi:MAG: DUF4388 domain-containing protein [Deltaproteobacteria bacterium]|nr:DUF4388 domain-containing protein [Deltaproteobacteria bacterium]MCL5792669.1 DUF4388 domain-containing protein [Deltaproteobacteria bacterium]
MITKGNLKDISFIKILISLYSEKSTGILRLTNGSEVKIVYISKGKPVFSASNSSSDRMGTMVSRLGLVSEAQLDAALKEVMKTGNRLGTILVNMGLLTPEQLFDLVLKQVSEIIYSVFEWDDGIYNFIEGAPFSDEVITLDLSMWTLILEGVKRKFSPDKLKELIGSTKTIIQKTASSEDGIHILKNTEGEKIYNLIDENKTVNNIVTEGSMGELKTIQILGVLRLLELIYPSSEKTETAETPMLKIEITSKLETFKNQNLFEKLGLDKTATKEQILSAFTQLSQKYRPDRFLDGEYAEIKPLATELYNQVLEAFTIIYKDTSREKYLRELSEEDKSMLSVESDPVLARQIFEKGKILVNEKNYRDAYNAFKTAIDNDSTIGEYYTAMGILETMDFSEHQINIANAEKAFLKANELNPEEARNLYYLGIIYKNKKEYKKARECFLKALVHNSNHKESKKQLELLEREE